LVGEESGLTDSAVNDLEETDAESAEDEKGSEREGAGEIEVVAARHPHENTSEVSGIFIGAYSSSSNDYAREIERQEERHIGDSGIVAGCIEERRSDCDCESEGTTKKEREPRGFS